jgi:hypothetical protein
MTCGVAALIAFERDEVYVWVAENVPELEPSLGRMAHACQTVRALMTGPVCSAPASRQWRVVPPPRWVRRANRIPRASHPKDGVTRCGSTGRKLFAWTRRAVLSGRLVNGLYGRSRRTAEPSGGSGVLPTAATSAAVRKQHSRRLTVTNAGVVIAAEACGPARSDGAMFVTVICLAKALGRLIIILSR